jgi:hypothetical protein
MGGSDDRPKSIGDLETRYGPASDSGWGSAVFWIPLGQPSELEGVARAVYRRFLGAKWDRFGESAWMGPWRRVHARAPGGRRDIAAELRGIEDAEAARSVSLVLEAMEDAQEARTALAAAFDGEDTTDLSVFHVGDGEAMSGLLLAGHRARAGHALVLVCLMD